MVWASLRPLFALLLVLLAIQGGPAAGQSTAAALAGLSAADVEALQPYLKSVAASPPLKAASLQPHPSLMAEKTALLCRLVKLCRYLWTDRQLGRLDRHVLVQIAAKKLPLALEACNAPPPPTPGTPTHDLAAPFL